MGLGDGSGVDGWLFSGRSSGRRWRPAVLLALAASLWAGLNLSASASAWIAWDADSPPTEGGWDRGPRLPERFTMVLGGDVLVHTGVWSQAAAYAGAGERFDFRPMFAPLRTLLTVADVAICHLETPVSPNDANLSSFPVFNVPHEIVDAIAWSGYDGCSTASNHSLDQGIAGIRATIDALEGAGLRHAGTASNQQESREITLYHVGKARIAHLSYSFSFNGRTPVFGWEANRLEVSRILADARRARKAGSDLTVVSLHWGSEYQHAATAGQRWIADRLTGSGLVDLVVGHHAHVVQPIGRSNGVPVAYGMGNQLSGQRASSLGTPSVEDGVLVWAVAELVHGRYRVTEVLVTPTWVAPSTYRILPAQATADDPALPGWLRAAARASFGRTMGEVLALGGRSFGVHAVRVPPLGAPF